MHYKTQIEEVDECLTPFCQVLGGELERIALHFSTHTGLLFIPPNAQRPPDIARARKFFALLDPLVQKIISIRDEQVQVEWSIPLPVSGKSQRGVSNAVSSRNQSSQPAILAARDLRQRKRKADSSPAARRANARAAANNSALLA